MLRIYKYPPVVKAARLGVVGGIGLCVLLAGCGIGLTSRSDQRDSKQGTSDDGEVKQVDDLAAILRADAPTKVTPPVGKDGLPPVVMSVKTTDKVVFLTIDDGVTKDPRVTKIIKKAGIPVTPFLTVNVTAGDTAYFKNISEMTGQTVQDHTITHPQLPKLSYAGQQEQICEPANKYTHWYGARPWMIRPPYGEWDTTTLQAAKSCGMKYVVLWDVSLPQRYLRYAQGDKLRPGDIILTHWRPDLYKHLRPALRDIARQGFKVAALQDYLPNK